MGFTVEDRHLMKR